MLELNKVSFQEEVLESKGLVLVDYWSTKCEPCIELMPEIVRLSEKYQEKVKFCKLNILENRRLAIGQKVMGLPTIIMYKDGEKLWSLSSEFTAEDVEKQINNSL
ncbi:thioredoxin [Alkalicella caledoniensis]|uniref:Thioredoxin n=1 Tax=Alkalicella caledoniensis TaxID=2731377 RepID=A0A7G9W942_ALKCA|nr:thioredoxin family protein [Alkalicella caledoniensis]QNO15204.1 thioredoxin [Alkalicella caledoniensis]